MRIHLRRFRTSILLVTGAICTIVPRSGRADGSRSLFGLDVEAFATRNLDQGNQQLFGFGFGGMLSAEINAHPLLGIHLGGGGMYLTRGGSPSASEWLGGRAGLRFHWGVLVSPRSRNDGWIDAHANYGESGGIARPGFDAGIGYALSPVRGFRVGPFVRYQFASDPLAQDAHWILFGLTVGILGDPRSPPETVADVQRDHDSDGVLDVDDLCPAEPAGARPDATRRGCPAHDQDADGVIDRDDHCPVIPSGASPDPDPRRLGCPLNDADNDGVFDEADQCPTVPAGVHADAVRRGCPAPDSDGDGVIDVEDLCAGIPAGTHPDAARHGCPADHDSDSVPDASDACPDAAGAPSRDPARNGCPGLVRIERRGGESVIQILRPVFFATDRDVILDESFPVLTAVTEAMLASGISRIRVEGHSDNRGNARRNLELSRRRAASVRQWMIAHGAADTAVESEGYGSVRPIEPNTTSMGRARNRRVEFHIVGASAETVSPAPSNARPAQ